MNQELWLALVGAFGIIVAVFGGWLWTLLQRDIARAHKKADEAHVANESLKLEVANNHNAVLLQVAKQNADAFQHLNDSMKSLTDSFHRDITGLSEQFQHLAGEFKAWKEIDQRRGGT